MSARKIVQIAAVYEPATFNEYSGECSHDAQTVLYTLRDDGCIFKHDSKGWHLLPPMPGVEIPLCQLPKHSG